MTQQFVLGMFLFQKVINQIETFARVYHTHYNNLIFFVAFCRTNNTTNAQESSRKAFLHYLHNNNNCCIIDKYRFKWPSRQRQRDDEEPIICKRHLSTHGFIDKKNVSVYRKRSNCLTFKKKINLQHTL